MYISPKFWRLILKLHWQFSHASYKKESDAAINDTQIFKILAELIEACEICNKCKQSSAKPNVRLSMVHTLVK